MFETSTNEGGEMAEKQSTKSGGKTKSSASKTASAPSRRTKRSTTHEKGLLEKTRDAVVDMFHSAAEAVTPSSKTPSGSNRGAKTSKSNGKDRKTASSSKTGSGRKTASKGSARKAGSARP